MPLRLVRRGRSEREKAERQFNPWQKIVSPPDGEVDVDKETGDPAWIHKYLDLADLLMRRVQAKWERAPFRRLRRRRDAA